MIVSLYEFTTDQLKELLYAYRESPSPGLRDEIIMTNIENILEERLNAIYRSAINV